MALLIPMQGPGGPGGPEGPEGWSCVNDAWVGNRSLSAYSVPNKVDVVNGCASRKRVQGDCDEVSRHMRERDQPLRTAPLPRSVERLEPIQLVRGCWVGPHTVLALSIITALESPEDPLMGYHMLLAIHEAQSRLARCQMKHIQLFHSYCLDCRTQTTQGSQHTIALYIQIVSSCSQVQREPLYNQRHTLPEAVPPTTQFCVGCR